MGQPGGALLSDTERPVLEGRPASAGAYQDALDYLFARTTGKWKFGLERVEALLDLLGRPHERLRCLHVGGTNGKGSVCATLEAVLLARGLRVAKYTSPHLVDFRERFLVNGAPAPASQVVEFVERWTPDIERMGVTFFEATTVMAFELFARAQVDVAIIEVGLGGRLDATNVIRPLAAGVTSIGLDHVEYLGGTREEIAAEKAGIFKRGIPAVIGERDPAIAALLARHAEEAGASGVRIVADTLPTSEVHVGADGTRFVLHAPDEAVAAHTPLAGVHQAWNAATAFALLDAAGEGLRATPREFVRALRQVHLTGRFHRHGRFLFDVAHNREGAAVTVATLHEVAPERPLTVLLSVLGDKDWRGMMEALAAEADRFVITLSPTSPASRAWHPEEAAAWAASHGWPVVLEPDFDRALAEAADGTGTVLVTGSFHTVGDAMARLQVNPLGA
jgi:dihydrofolate synthase/folylpolyglutamate synthase